CVPVRAGVERVARVVAVHQVDPAGDRLHPVDRVGQLDAGRVGVAGVQAEADLAVSAVRGRADIFPEPGERAIAPLPPAVFSMSIGSGRSICSIALTQFATPAAGSVSPVTCPPCTISPLAPIAAAAFSCWSSSFRLGMRIRLLVDATLITYGAWM